MMPRFGWRRRRGAFRRRFYDRFRRIANVIAEFLDRIRKAGAESSLRYRKRLERIERRLPKHEGEHYLIRTYNTVHSEARRVSIRSASTYSALAMASSPIRLIEHRLCKTSKPVYIHAVTAFQVSLDRIRGVYMAVCNAIDRLRLPMARRLYHFVQDAYEPFSSFVRALRQLLLKPTTKAFTTLIKVAGKLSSYADRIPVIRSLKGYIRNERFSVLTVFGHLAERFRAMMLGARELVFYRRLKHCSFYVYVTGAPYYGLPSAWYYWKKRFVYCSDICRNYDDYRRGICVSVCNDMIGLCDPTYFLKCVDRAREYIPEFMARFG